jgi:hypothetical protein
MFGSKDLRRFRSRSVFFGAILGLASIWSFYNLLQVTLQTNPLDQILLERYPTGKWITGNSFRENVFDAKRECPASRSDFRSASGVFAIIAGCENSGTTVTSEFIMSAPYLLGAFECGILLSPTPSDFVNVHPFYEWITDGVEKNQWALSTIQRERLLNATCHAEMYSMLHIFSPVYRHFPDSLIVDKTPGYIYELDAVMDRSPGVPVVVSVKSDEDQLRSWTKRYKKPDQTSLLERLQKAKQGLQRALDKYPGRIHVVNTTELYKDPNKAMDQVYDFLGLQWNPEFLSLKHFNIKGKTVGFPQVQPFDAEWQ